MKQVFVLCVAHRAVKQYNNPVNIITSMITTEYLFSGTAERDRSALRQITIIRPRLKRD